MLDINASYLGVHTLTLMENAGKAVAEEVLRAVGPKRRIAIVCGKGNNAGDGFVAARVMRDRCAVTVFPLVPEDELRSEVALTNFRKVKDLVRPAEEFRPAEFDLIVDAILGVGARPGLPNSFVKAIQRLNRSRRPVVSIDVPSGWPHEPAVKPTTTVTLHAAKEGMGRARCGKIVVADIGIPPEADRYVGPGEFIYYPRPESESHKGDNGRLLVIAGGPFTGAPGLVGLAALRMGADLSVLAVPETIRGIVASFSPNLVVHPLPGDHLSPEHLPLLQPLIEAADAVAIGPGLGLAAPTQEAVRRIVRAVPKPLAIDADALKAIGIRAALLKGRRGVLTPHHGEAKALLGRALPTREANLVAALGGLAKRTGFTVLLKGHIDLITDGTHVKWNRTGNAGMTVGGTGDVLTGIVGALLAKGVSPYNAARIGAFANGFAGDLAFEERRWGLVATDVLEALPAVLQRFT